MKYEFYVYRCLRKTRSPFYISKKTKNRINESHSLWLILLPIEDRKNIKNNLSEKANQ